MALNPRRTALLVCDMQERFRAGIYNFDSIAATISRMIKAAAVSAGVLETHGPCFRRVISWINLEF